MERSHGYKYEDQKGKTLAEIAAMMRTDIKQAITEGLLPAGPKYRVRTETYAGGGSINITVTDWLDAWQDCDGFKPGDAPVSGRGRELCRNHFCAARLELMKETRPGAESHQVLTLEARAAELTLERIHSDYNHNGSDIMTDHFDVNYYGGVKFQDARSAAFWAEENAKKAARRAAVDKIAADADTRRVVVYGSKGKRTYHDAVEVGGRTRLVCGAQLWGSSMVGDADGHDLTCSRCVKRAAKAAPAVPVAEPVAREVRVMHTYDVLLRNPVRVPAPGRKLVRVSQIRLSAETGPAREIIAALFPDAIGYRAPDSLPWITIPRD